jgi:hypothetical protein
MQNNEYRNSAFFLNKGLRNLSDHRPDLALDSLRLAVEAIPPACGEELSRALYWLSVALLRLDKKDLALKSLSSAQKLRRRGFARRFYLHNVNEYGMPKQPTAELDDFYAFMSVQLAAYLVRRPNRRFATQVERETVLKIIAEAWKLLVAGAAFAQADCGEKLQLFKRTKPSFPFFGTGSSGANILRHGFERHGYAAPAQESFGRRCACGSGLAYSRCCGRVRGLGEL